MRRTDRDRRDSLAKWAGLYGYRVKFGVGTTRNTHVLTREEPPDERSFGTLHAMEAWLGEQARARSRELWGGLS